MQKLFNFLVVGLTFAVLNVGTVEAADCSDFTPGTPPFQSCVAQNQESAGGTPAADCSDFTPGTPPFQSCVASNTSDEGNQSGGDAGAGALENAAAEPSFGERVKSLFGIDSTDIPAADTSAAPIGEGGEAGGPAATDMSGNMINDGGFGANSGADAEAEKKAAAIAKCRSMDRTKQIDCEADWEMEVYQ
jgi:hypothetical protein